MADKKSDVDEERADKEGKCQVRADMEPDAPQDNLDLDCQQEEDEQEDEALIVVPEFRVIVFIRIDAGKNGKQSDTGSHNDRDEAKPP